MLNREDVAVLRELAGSVYLTPRQRLALGRLLARAELPAPALIAGAVLSGSDDIKSRVDALAEAAEVYEHRRQALLGSCGAE